MSDGRFDSALWKVGRARKHIDDLAAEVRAFWATEPYEIELVASTETEPGHYRVKRIEPLPESMPLLAGDAAHNVRSALDHLAWAATPEARRSAETAFPIWGSRTKSAPGPEEWRRFVKQKLAGVRPALADAVTRLQPWASGRDSLLWAAHELDRVDKHRLLLSVAAALTHAKLEGDGYELEVFRRFSGMDPDSPITFKPIKWRTLEMDKVIFGSPEEFGASAVNLIFEVTLGEPEMLTGQPVMNSLTALADETERVIRELIPVA